MAIGNCGKGRARRPEDHLSGVPEVEGGLVTRAQQVVGLLLPQADRAADVGADLGVAKDPADIPAFAGRGIVMVFGSIRTTMTAALAFSIWNSAPSRS